MTALSSWQLPWMITKRCILSLPFLFLLPDFNSWFQGQNGPFTSSGTILSTKVVCAIDHQAVVVKWCFSYVVGVVGHFAKVMLLARLHIFQENRDMEVTVWSCVLVHCTWFIHVVKTTSSITNKPKACRVSWRIIPLWRHWGEPRLTSWPFPPTLPTFEKQLVPPIAVKIRWDPWNVAVTSLEVWD